MRNYIHNIYVIVGTVFCDICLMWWKIRDKINPPKTNAVLFVAHPDDDTLFFHTFIKEYKPYVCLMTTGWSLRRLPCFVKAMKSYGVQYRAYPFMPKGKQVALLKKHVDEVLKIHSFDIVATHNENGEYGHEEHTLIHQVVKKVVCNQNARIKMYCPVDKMVLLKYPLSETSIKEKKVIFKTMYVTESWVLDENKVWIENEKLEEITI